LNVLFEGADDTGRRGQRILTIDEDRIAISRKIREIEIRQHDNVEFKPFRSVDRHETHPIFPGTLHGSTANSFGDLAGPEEAARCHRVSDLNTLPHPLSIPLLKIRLKQPSSRAEHFARPLISDAAPIFFGDTPRL